jgi:hypothetical protein
MTSKQRQHRLFNIPKTHSCYTIFMSTIKTLVNNASVNDFINTVNDETKKSDAFILLDIYKKATEQVPRMWGTSIIGFGAYHYKSKRSTQEGDWPLVAFSPRKQSLTLYIMSELNDYSSLLSKLGKHKTSKGCLYINKLSDVNVAILEQLIKRSYEDAKRNLTPNQV